MEDNLIITKEKTNTSYLVKGFAFSIICTLALLLIFSILLTYTNISEDIIPFSIIGISATSILIGSIVSTKKLNKNGLLNGGIVGIVHMILIYFSSSVLNTGFRMNFYTILMIVIGILCGIVGGIIGVNLK